MAAAVRSRSEFDGAALRKLARASRDAKQVRRLLALAAIHQGGTRGEAARLGGITLQIVRDWVMRFNAKEPAGLVDRKPPGCRPMLGADQRRALAEIVQAGPVPAAHRVVRWRSIDLAQRVWDEVGVGRVRAGLPRSTAIELWWQDEARVGQTASRRWPRRGTRPSAPHDQRTASAYRCLRLSTRSPRCASTNTRVTSGR